MEHGDGGILSIRDRFVEYASASHDALDKTLLPPSAFPEVAIAHKNKGISIAHLYPAPTSGPWGPERETSVYCRMKMLLCTLRPVTPLTASPPHSTIGAWG